MSTRFPVPRCTSGDDSKCRFRLVSWGHAPGGNAADAEIIYDREGLPIEGGSARTHRMMECLTCLKRFDHVYTQLQELRGALPPYKEIG